MMSTRLMTRMLMTKRNGGWADVIGQVLVMGKNSRVTNLSQFSVKAKKDNVKKKTVKTGVQ